MRKPVYFSIFLYVVFLLPLQTLNCSETGIVITGEIPEDGCLINLLQALPDHERKALAPEFDFLLSQLQKRLLAIAKGEIIDATVLHEEISPEEAMFIFGPCLGVEDYQTNPNVKKLFSTCFSPQFYFVRQSKKAGVTPDQYFNEEELEEIYQTAKRLLNITSSGDHLISLGQSPVYVVTALQEMISTVVWHENYRNLCFVPFSGAPDLCHLNFHYKKLHVANVVTPDSLSYYRQTLEGLGVSPFLQGPGQKVYVIDLIGSGGSIASFIKLMVNWYDSLGISLPEFTLLDISVENRNFRNQTRVSLPLSLTCQIHIDRVFVHTTAHLSDKLDYTEGEDRVIPPFGPLQWKPEYEHIYRKYPHEYAAAIIERVREYVRLRTEHNLDIMH